MNHVAQCYEVSLNMNRNLHRTQQVQLTGMIVLATVEQLHCPTNYLDNSRNLSYACQFSFISPVSAAAFLLLANVLVLEELPPRPPSAGFQLDLQRVM